MFSPITCVTTWQLTATSAQTGKWNSFPLWVAVNRILSVYWLLSIYSYPCMSTGAQAGRNKDLNTAGLWELCSERSRRRRLCSFKQLFTDRDTSGGRMTGSLQESTFGWFSWRMHSPVFILHLNCECLTHPRVEAGRVWKQCESLWTDRAEEPPHVSESQAKHIQFQHCIYSFNSKL